MRIRWYLAFACIVLTGCHTAAVGAALPAHRIDPDECSQHELQRVVSAALNDARIRIAADALTEHSLLVIERERHLGPDGTRAMGRELEMPIRFRLLKQQDRCILEHLGPGTRWLLEHTKCRPVED